MDQRTFDDFDEFANNYRSIHTENIRLAGADSFYFAEMKIKLLQPFEKNQTVQVLDVGCGDGTTELFMQQYFRQWQVMGIDISEKSILSAQARMLPGANFLVYNGTTIPSYDQSFDIVFIAGVLHHIHYDLHDAIVKEVSRVLKKGGRLYLFEHNPFNPLTRYFVNTCVFDKDARLLNSRYTSSLLKKHQFIVTVKQFIIFFPRKGVLSKFIFLEKYLQWVPFGGQYLIRAIK